MGLRRHLNSRDDTIEQRVGKWALRQFVLLPLVILVAVGFLVVLSLLSKH